jgi:hypothetical protein
MKLRELKQIIKEEIYKELNENIFSNALDRVTTCTLDDLYKKIEKICKSRSAIKCEIEKDDSQNKVEVKLDNRKYQSNDLISIPRDQTEEGVYEILKKGCGDIFGIFYTPLSKFCTGILKTNRPIITMYVERQLPVIKEEEEGNKTKMKYYMYSILADWSIYDGMRKGNYNIHKRELYEQLSYDSVTKMSNIIRITFFLEHV